MPNKKIQPGEQFLPYAALRGFEKLVARSFERSAEEGSADETPLSAPDSASGFAPGSPPEHGTCRAGIRRFDDPDTESL